MLLFGFHQQILFGAPSEGGGGGGGGGSWGDDEPMMLGRIVFDSPPPMIGGGDGNSLGGGGGSGNGTAIVEGDHVQDQVIEIFEGATIILGSDIFEPGTNPQSPFILYDGADFAERERAAIEQEYQQYQGVILESGWDEEVATEILAWHDWYWAEGDTDGMAALGDWLYPIAELVPREHLEMMVLVEQGYTIAAAHAAVYQPSQIDLDSRYIVSADLQIQDFVAVTEAALGDNQSVLVSSGIDVTEGVMVVNPTSDLLPSFAIPVRPGMNAYTADPEFQVQQAGVLSAGLGVLDSVLEFGWEVFEGDGEFNPHHRYEVSVALRSSDLPDIGSVDVLELINDAIIENPENNGFRSPASIQGTLNNLEQLVPGTQADNLVYSYLVENDRPGETNLVVNYTAGTGEHIGETGWVAIGAVAVDNTPENLEDNDFDYVLNMVGEGNSPMMGAPFAEEVSDAMAHNEWAGYAEEIFQGVYDELF